jgi:uncharacterized coiled-coil protein SlyX
VQTLRQIWQRTCARLAKPFKPQSCPAPSPLELERGISIITREHQTLAAELQRFRAGSEQARADENRRIAILEGSCQAAMTARIGEAKLLAELERRIAELETEHKRTIGVVESLESSLTDASTRVDTMDGELRILRARTDERTREFEDSLSLAIARQVTTDGELKALRDMSEQQVKALEMSLADTSTRLETTANEVRTLEKRLDLEHRLYVHTVQDVQSQVRRQDQRLNWTMMAAVLAILLGTVAGGLLIWDVQQNARTLTGMSKDVKRLMSAMGQSHETSHQALGIRQAARRGRVLP